MNNDTVGPKSDDDSGAEPSGSNTIPPRGPERETKGAAAFLRSRRTAVAITATTLVVGGFVGMARVHGIRGERQPGGGSRPRTVGEERSPGRRYGSRRGLPRRKPIAKHRPHTTTPIHSPGTSPPQFPSSGRRSSRRAR